MYDEVTAVTWGPWRAEFVEPVDGGHRVRVRAHLRPRDPNRRVPPVYVAELIAPEPTEAGLRSVLWDYAVQQGMGTKVHDASPLWVERLVGDEFPEPVKRKKKPK